MVFLCITISDWRGTPLFPQGVGISLDFKIIMSNQFVETIFYLFYLLPFVETLPQVIEQSLFLFFFLPSYVFSCPERAGERIPRGTFGRKC